MSTISARTKGHLPCLLSPDDQLVASADPLGFDGQLPRLWKLNAASDARGLVQLLGALIPARHALERWLPWECAAAMRDIGMLLGSVRRLGTQPVSAVPDAEPVLLELAARTGMVPRDTIFHYTGWNPVGHRERLYTGDLTESLLISSVRVTLPRLDSAVAGCGRLTELDPSDPDFARTANEVVVLIRSLEDAIDIVAGNVPPAYFARTMRPYFEPVRVAGVDYLGPAAAHVPLYLLDLALWASDYDGSGHDNGASSPSARGGGYTGLWRESAQFILPRWSAMLRDWPERSSLTTRVARALAAAPAGTGQQRVHASAEAVSRALRALVVFRGKHLSVARKAYSPEIRLHPLGSGGGSVGLLAEIASLIRASSQELRVRVASGQADGGRAS